MAAVDLELGLTDEVLDRLAKVEANYYLMKQFLTDDYQQYLGFIDAYVVEDDYTFEAWLKEVYNYD